VTDMNKRMKAKNECVNKIYCVCLQYKLLFIYIETEKSQKVNEGKICIVTRVLERPFSNMNKRMKA